MTNECGNWEQGRADSFLGIHKSDLLCSAAPEMGSSNTNMTDRTVSPVYKLSETPSFTGQFS
jgi:hypothetical protein